MALMSLQESIQQRKLQASMTPSELSMRTEADILEASRMAFKSLDTDKRAFAESLLLGDIIHWQRQERHSAIAYNLSPWLTGRTAEILNQRCVEHIYRELVMDIPNAPNTDEEVGALKKKVAQIVQIVAAAADKVCSRDKGKGQNNAYSPA